MRTEAAQQVPDEIARLAHLGLDLPSFWRAATRQLRKAVPFDFFPCWFTLDPTSLLVTGHYNPEVPVEDHEVPTIVEYLEEKYDGPATLAARENLVITWDEVTGGDSARSLRYRENLLEWGVEHELAALLRADGASWGAVTLHRRHGQPPFGAEEVSFVAEVAPYLAEGARRSLVVSDLAEDAGPDTPCLVVLDANLAVDSVTPGAERSLADLPGGANASTGRLPFAVLAVAARVRRVARGETDSSVSAARARVLSRTGRWVVLHGASLLGPTGERFSVIIEPAHPSQRAPLLMDAFGLTEREQEVARLVLQGRSTDEIARMLYVSPYTVQDHLKAAFYKSGVRSRRELVARVLFDGDPSGP